MLNDAMSVIGGLEVLHDIARQSGGGVKEYRQLMALAKKHAKRHNINFEEIEEETGRKFAEELDGANGK